ncbi:MAG: hypothetical protein AB7R89_13695 [Dehalococcoidia bacterium]
MRLSRLERSLLLAGRGPFLSPDGDAGGGDGSTDTRASSSDTGGTSGPDTKDGDGSDGKIEFTKEQQDHIGKLLSKERKAAADKARADAKAEADAAAEQARKDKEAADLKAKGDFEQVETTLKADLKTAQDEATALKGEVDQLRAAMAEGIAVGWKDLPEEVRKVGEKQHAEDDVLGRWTFLNDPDTKALVAKLTDKAERKSGNGYSPKSSGDGKVPDADKQKAQSGLYRKF